MKSKVYIGVDPGFGNVGVTVCTSDRGIIRLESMNVIRTKKDKKGSLSVSEDNVRRAQQIYKEIFSLALNKFIVDSKGEHYEYIIFAEAMSFPRNASSAGKISLCWGVLAAIAAAEQITLKQVTPKKIKMTLTGKNTATKEEVISAVKDVFKKSDFDVILKKIPKTLHEHVFDAAGAIVTGLAIHEDLNIKGLPNE